MNSNLQTKYNFEVNTYDIDVAGHVNNIVYVRWLEDLRTKLLNEHFSFHKLIADKFYPVVISTNINYKKQIKLFDKPIGIMKISSYNHGVMILEAVIRLGNIIAVKAEQKCAIVDLKNSQMISQNRFSEFTKSL